MKRCLLFILGATLSWQVLGQELPLTATRRIIPGVQPTPWLTYESWSARTVEISGSWNSWTSRHSMTKNNALWTLDIRTLALKPGRHEYKFIVNNQWETGDNRIFYINDDKLLEQPPDNVLSATLDAPNEVTIYLRRPAVDPSKIRIQLDPPVAIQSTKIASGRTEGTARGYSVAGNIVTFLLDEKTYQLNLTPQALVTVAGNFNGWDGKGGGQGQWRLNDQNNDGVWELSMTLDSLRVPGGQHELLFKFVVNEKQWLSPAAHTINAKSDGKGNMNFHLDPKATGTSALKIFTAEPLNLSENYTLIIEGLADRKIRFAVSPGKILETLISDKELGVVLDKEQHATTYRLFAPRAQSVHLCIFDSAEHQKIEPIERYPLWKDEADGVWEISLLGLDAGKYYSFNVAGPAGDGESFSPNAQIGDPYAYAAAHANNNTIVMDREITNQWFHGWSDDAYRTPRHEDMVIYETHIRDFTADPSSRVPGPLRGTYQGFLEGVGLDHLKNIGVNMIELMPINEFENGIKDYGWGYSPVYYFSPEASYAQAPLQGSQYYEFKRLVNELHRRGFGVILDVVYNHVGSPNIFSLIDKKYYFRLAPDYSFLNFSGCGNDIRSEAPMMRRLIVDNIRYWMEEHHVDGFRFDLGELIDMETMLAVRDAAKKINPNVLLVSEPWSFRGENKRALKGTGWAAWNDTFRNAVRNFINGRDDGGELKKTIAGSTEIWSAHPLQAVNYMESHDDMAFIDELSARSDKNGQNLEPREIAINRLAATLIFTSLGIPMISEGQEFLRSKFGIHNTYNKGDQVNAIRWTDRERPLAAEAMNYYKGLIELRRSPQGAAFRVAEKTPPDYYKWITPSNAKALGYIVNAAHQIEGHGFIVLLNPSYEKAKFAFQLPPGRWRTIGDGRSVNLAGLPGHETKSGPLQTVIDLEPASTMIFMDGF